MIAARWRRSRAARLRRHGADLRRRRGRRARLRRRSQEGRRRRSSSATRRRAPPTPTAAPATCATARRRRSAARSACRACDPDDAGQLRRRRLHAVGRLPARAARCRRPGEIDPCPAPLICRRTTDSPLEAAGGARRRLPAAQRRLLDATTTAHSPVFNDCTSNVNGATQGTGLLTTGKICVQGKCGARDIACEPGSACIRDVLPSTIPAPDVCSPICTPVRDRKPTAACSTSACPAAPACRTRSRRPTRRRARPASPAGCASTSSAAPPAAATTGATSIAQVRGLRDLRAAVQDRRRLRALRSRRQPRVPLAQHLPRRRLPQLQQHLLPADLPARRRRLPARFRGQVHRAAGRHGHGAVDGPGRVRRRGGGVRARLLVAVGLRHARRRAAHPDDLRHHQQLQRLRADDPRHHQLHHVGGVLSGI